MEAEHLSFRLVAMQVLGAWALLNLVVGTVAAWRAHDVGWRAFWASNAAWNVVNLALAAFGARAAAGHVAGTWTGVTLLQEVDLFLRILLVNLGLDVGYVATGVVLLLSGRSGGGGRRQASDIAGLCRKGRGALYRLSLEVVPTDPWFLASNRRSNA